MAKKRLHRGLDALIPKKESLCIEGVDIATPNEIDQRLARKGFSPLSYRFNRALGEVRGLANELADRLDSVSAGQESWDLLALLERVENDLIDTLEHMGGDL